MTTEPYVILKDEPHFIAVAKAAGVPVIPERGPNPAKPLVELLSEKLGIKLWVVHRLDRETSGVLVFAKDAETHKALSQAFEKHEAKKKYLVAVLGRVHKDGTIRQALKEFGSGRVGTDPKGKPSVTHYRALRANDQASLLEVEPETGRRHQIRAHLYAIGHPVLGDPKYGQERPVGGATRLMLHAVELIIPLGEGLAETFHAELTEDFGKVMEGFGLNKNG